MKIADGTALVTGGASGLGEASVRRLHSLGANTAILDMNRDRGEALAAELGSKALFVEVNVTDTESVQAAVKNVLEHFGSIRFVINCAGTGWVQKIASKNGPHDLDVFKKILDLNLVGTVDVSRWAAYYMLSNEPDEEGERGVIINTASVAAFDGQMGQLAYAASKAGVAGMTLVIARDLSRAGIRCCTIAPGLFDTPLLSHSSQEMRDHMIEQMMFPKRFGKADEFALLVQQIVENPYLNGEVIRLDAGMRMHAK